MNIDWIKLWKELRIQFQETFKKRGIEDSIKFWDEIAIQYAENVRKRWNVYINKAYEIAKILNLDKECTILEIGSGPGTYTLPLSRIVKHVTVVEPSKSMINELVKN